MKSTKSLDPNHIKNFLVVYENKKKEYETNSYRIKLKIPPINLKLKEPVLKAQKNQELFLSIEKFKFLSKKVSTNQFNSDRPHVDLAKMTSNKKETDNLNQKKTTKNSKNKLSQNLENIKKVSFFETTKMEKNLNKLPVSFKIRNSSIYFKHNSNTNENAQLVSNKQKTIDYFKEKGKIIENPKINRNPITNFNDFQKPKEVKELKIDDSMTSLLASVLPTSPKQELLEKPVNKCKLTSILDSCEGNYESIKEEMLDSKQVNLDSFGIKIWKRRECLFKNKTEQKKRKTKKEFNVCFSESKRKKTKIVSAQQIAACKIRESMIGFVNLVYRKTEVENILESEIFEEKYAEDFQKIKKIKNKNLIKDKKKEFIDLKILANDFKGKLEELQMVTIEKKVKLKEEFEINKYLQIKFPDILTGQCAFVNNFYKQKPVNDSFIFELWKGNKYQSDYSLQIDLLLKGLENYQILPNKEYKIEGIEEIKEDEELNMSILWNFKKKVFNDLIGEHLNVIGVCT